MNTTFQKEDPSCFNVLPIRWDECPEQSLSTIGINFSALDVEVCNLGFSATNIWNPLYNEFQENSATWNSVFTTVQEASSCWQSTFNTVQALSASWLSPISIVYPSILAKGTFNVSTVVSWVRANFPISEGDCLNYLNGQVMKLFTMEYATSEQTVTCRCTAKGGTYTVRFIGVSSIKRSCPCRCLESSVTCNDRYVNLVNGIELVVEDGVWVYLKDIY